MSLKRINWVHFAVAFVLGYVIRGMGGVGGALHRL